MDLSKLPNASPPGVLTTEYIPHHRPVDRQNEYHPQSASLGTSEPSGLHTAGRPSSVGDGRPDSTLEVGPDNSYFSSPPLASGVDPERPSNGNTREQANGHACHDAPRSRNTQATFILLRHYARLTEQARENTEVRPTDPREVYRINVVFVIEDFFDQVPELREE